MKTAVREPQPQPPGAGATAAAEGDDDGADMGFPFTVDDAVAAAR